VRESIGCFSPWRHREGWLGLALDTQSKVLGRVRPELERTVEGLGFEVQGLGSKVWGTVR
jgi:hypothetical protein